MFSLLADFLQTWEQESQATQRILNVLTDDSLNQKVTTHDRTLGRVAWHIVTTIPEMMSKTGLVVQVVHEDAPVHRGQMTVLMRQAGLKVPGIYGPAREEWSQFGMEALVL